MARKQPVRKSKSPILWIVLAALVVISGAAIALPRLLGNASAATLPLEVNVSQAAKLRDSGAFVLDVREPSEWNQFHISGATLIPLGELQSRLSEVPQDQKILVYCRTGHRSASGRDILLTAGYKNVTSMAGGITDWIAQGYPTVSGP